MTCPSCGAAVADGERFCENCGVSLAGGGADTPAAPVSSGDPGGAGGAGGAGETAITEPATAPTNDPTVRTCARCGGAIAADGFCEQCGEPASTERDHFTESPAPWLAGVCDRGVRHPRNEDAMALGVTGSGAGVLVVCDGVSTAPRSDVASLAAAAAARDVLLGAGTIVDAGSAAQDAVVKSAGSATGADAPSCTFAAATVAEGVLTAGWVGDSRIYWLPDHAPARLVSTDHSWAQEMIAQGMSRDEAEKSPHAHAITRWLGPDAPAGVADTLTVDLGSAAGGGSGWLLVCSDGLWNYCSASDDLAAVVRSFTGVDHSVAPADLASRLVGWANDQGGHDNITVALARVQP